MEKVESECISSNPQVPTPISLTGRFMTGHFTDMFLFKFARANVE